MNVPTNAGSFPRFLVLGGAHVDRRAKADGPFHPGASNPGSLSDMPGGAAFNAALALRGLGCPVGIVSVRGGDDDGRRIAGAIETAGIADLSATFLDRRTATYLAVLDDHGELVAGIADMAIYDRLGPKFLKRKSIRDALGEADALILDANLPTETLVAALEGAEDRPVAAIGVSPAKVRRLLPVIPSLAALFLSRAEAASLAEVTVMTKLSLICEIVGELGARRAVISDGGLDAAILDGDERLYQRPPVVRPRDVTGAGDTLAAVTFHALLGGGSFVESARRGIAAASLRIASDVFPPDDLSADIERLAGQLAPATTET
ncbi:carbohydrate kinase [Jiella endophytica]|uniref:Carbohydrate kinase n=1 Tax=Jiella endophytica TaxID=2558362 RepID=A0A4Y8RCM1_9HYPH|nr:carbohydrate kinase family protein [Jiella endophytica]TFF19704.1 carbohydrate kinase [Jiella endophytica]